MKDKDYIRDDGRIRECYSNIAKMNVGEYMILKITSKCFWKRALSDTLEVFCEGIKNLGIGIINALLVLVLPIALPINE